MLREAMANGSALGQMVKKIMEEGSLVPDDVILDIVAERVAKDDCANGFILDGVPRTLAQAEALEARGVRIDHVISIEIDDSIIEGRMTGRRVCGKCGASYHVVANPPKTEGICDQCGAELMIRKDDAPETVRHRLEVYHASTEILKDFYGKLGKLRLVEGNQSIEGANRDILAAIGERA
jgi:adenylate kinase